MVLNTLSNYAGKIITLGVWFFLTPFLVRALGPSAYGLWVLVGSAVAYGGLLDFGIGAAVTKFVAEDSAQGDFDHARPLVTTALWLYIGLGLLAIALSALLAPFFPELFNVPPEQRVLASWLVLASGTALGIALPTATASAVLQGLQRFDLANLIGILGMTVFTVTTVAVVLLGGGVLGLVLINIPVTIAMQIPAIWLVNRAAPALRFGRGRPDAKLVRRVFGFSSALVIVNLAGQIQTQTDELVIGAALPVASVTPYALARRLSALPQTLANQFVKVLMPLAARLNASPDRSQLSQVYLISTRLTLALAAPIVAVLAVLARPILTVWVGAEYADAAPILTILTIASLIDTSMWPASNILQGMGRHRPLAVFAVGSALANLLMSIWLVRPLNVLGVALGTLIPTTLEAALFVIPYALRQSGVSVKAMFQQVLGPSLLPLVPAAGALYMLRELMHPANYLTLGLVALGGAGVYAGAYGLLTRGEVEQVLLRQAATQAWAVLRTRARGGRDNQKPPPG